MRTCIRKIGRFAISLYGLATFVTSAVLLFFIALFYQSFESDAAYNLHFNLLLLQPSEYDISIHKLRNFPEIRVVAESRLKPDGTVATTIQILDGYGGFPGDPTPTSNGIIVGYIPSSRLENIRVRQRTATTQVEKVNRSWNAFRENVTNLSCTVTEKENFTQYHYIERFVEFAFDCSEHSIHSRNYRGKEVVLTFHTRPDPGKWRRLASNHVFVTYWIFTEAKYLESKKRPTFGGMTLPESEGLVLKTSGGRKAVSTEYRWIPEVRGEFREYTKQGDRVVYDDNTLGEAVSDQFTFQSAESVFVIQTLQWASGIFMTLALLPFLTIIAKKLNISS